MHPVLQHVTQPPPNEILVKEWEFAGETRKVSFLRNHEDILICQVFDRATQEITRRSLQKKGLEYQNYVLQNMHPQLCSSETKPACAAVFIDNRATQVGKAYGGAEGTVEIRLLRHPNGKFNWCVIETATNQFNVIKEPDSTDQRGSALERCYIKEVIYNENGVPTSFTFGKKKVYHWTVGGKRISLLRSKTNLYYQVSGSPPGRIPLPPGFSIEDGIAQLRTRLPVIDAVGRAVFKRRTVFQSELSDNRQDFVDQNTWAVRLVDTGRSKFNSISTWGGHAVILIEGVKEDGYFIERGDLRLLIGEDGEKPEVRLYNITEDFLDLKAQGISRISPRAWLRPKLEVEKIRRAILEDKEKLTQDPSHITFSLFGFDRSTKNPIAYVVLYIENLGRYAWNLGRSRILSRPHNCMSWAKEKIGQAGIDVPRPFFVEPVRMRPADFLDPISRHKDFIQRRCNNPYLTLTKETT